MPGSPAISLALNPEYLSLLWSRRHELINTGNLSFSLTWCGCYFNSPQNAPVGLRSSNSGALCSPSSGEPFRKDLLTSHLINNVTKGMKAGWFLKPLWSFPTNCQHSAWLACAAFSYNAFHFCWQTLTVLRTLRKEKADAHSVQDPFSVFMACWLQIKMQNELGGTVHIRLRFQWKGLDNHKHF